MAVEARHLNLFPPQILRETTLNGVGGMNYGGGMMYGSLSPNAGTAATAVGGMFPVYGEPTLAKDFTLRGESDLACANLFDVSRKRCREDSSNSINVNQLSSYPSTLQNPNISVPQFTFLGEDFSSEIQRQQLETDRFIALHNAKVRLEMEERRKSNSRRIIAPLEESIMKKLREKDDEIQKIAKINWSLEERVKSLCMENNIWRDLAQTNEATANLLRSNLEQVLAQVQDEHQLRHGNIAAELVDDAQSCCGSNENEIVQIDTKVVESSHDEGGSNSNRLCRSCGKDEACVLLLPCRHLCLCTVCGSSQHICPVCRSTKNCSLHINLS